MSIYVFDSHVSTCIYTCITYYYIRHAAHHIKTTKMCAVHSSYRRRRLRNDLNLFKAKNTKAQNGQSHISHTCACSPTHFDHIYTRNLHKMCDMRVVRAGTNCSKMTPSLYKSSTCWAVGLLDMMCDATRSKNVSRKSAHKYRPNQAKATQVIVVGTARYSCT